MPTSLLTAFSPYPIQVKLQDLNKKIKGGRKSLRKYSFKCQNLNEKTLIECYGSTKS